MLKIRLGNVKLWFLDVGDFQAEGDGKQVIAALKQVNTALAKVLIATVLIVALLA